MRCKACDTLLTDDELKLIDHNNNAPLDLCYDCVEAGEDNDSLEDE